MTHTFQQLGRGAIGVGSQIAAWSVTHASVDEYLKTLSLVIGIFVGIASLASIIHKWNK